MRLVIPEVHADDVYDIPTLVRNDSPVEKCFARLAQPLLCTTPAPIDFGKVDENPASFDRRIQEQQQDVFIAGILPSCAGP